MEESTTPAEGVVSGASTEESTTSTAAAEAPVSESPSTEKPSPPTPEPDFETLLSNPDYRKRVFDHPDTKKEFEHRVASEAGRRAKAEVERIQMADRFRQQQEQASAERERLLNMDEFELGEQRKKELREQYEAETLQSKLQPYQQQTEVQVLAKTGQEFFTSVYALAQEAGASDAELEQLNPQQYASLGEYVKGAIKFMATREGKRLSKDMAKVEAAAMLEERAAKERDENLGPVALPPANGRGPLTRDDLANMSPEEYRRNQDKVWEQLARR